MKNLSAKFIAFFVGITNIIGCPDNTIGETVTIGETGTVTIDEPGTVTIGTPPQPTSGDTPEGSTGTTDEPNPGSTGTTDEPVKPTTTEPESTTSDSSATDGTSEPTSNCGDGIVDGGEECDEGALGNLGLYGTCNANCTLAPYCGDGDVYWPYRECDPGNPESSDICNTYCKIAYCQDGIVQNWEQCDDNNWVNDDACTDSCTTPVCGDGIVQPINGEECDFSQLCKNCTEGYCPVEGNDPEVWGLACNNEGPGKELFTCSNETCKVIPPLG